MKLLKMQKLVWIMLLPILACASKKNTVSTPILMEEAQVTEEEQTREESDKTVDEVLQEEEKERPEECLHPFGKDPQDSLDMRRTISLYDEEIEKQNYVVAYPMWQKIINNAPCARVGPYFDAEVMFPQLFAMPQFAERKEVLTDSFMKSFEMRIYYHGNEGATSGRWAYYMNYYQPKNFARVIELCERSIELMKNEVEYIVPSTYINAVLLGLKNKKLPKEKVFEAYENVSSILDYNANQEGEAAQQWQQIQRDIEESIKNFLTCEDIDEIMLPQWHNNPEDAGILDKLVRFYRTSRCFDNPNYIQVLNALFELKPSANAAEELAKYYENKEDLKRTNEYYEKAAELTEDTRKKELFYVKISANHVKANNNSQAKAFANKALGVNPNNGTALIVLAVVNYNIAQSSCDDFNKKAAAWVTIDMLQKAINLDPSVKEDAQKRINTYKKYAPDKQSAFFRGINSGDTVQVDCLGVSTTARFFE